MAIIFMSNLEMKALQLTPLKLELYGRYIDDCCVVWCHGLSKLLEFVEFMGTRHLDIKFIVEHTLENVDCVVSYLDLSISCKSGVLRWELFMKSSHSGVFLSYLSSLPQPVKLSVAANQFD